MKTPFCTALRVQQRAVDELRVAISVTVEQLSRVELEGRALEHRTAAERACAVTDWTLPENRFFERLRAERARQIEEQALADAELARLREQARQAYGSLRVLEQAASAFKEDAQREMESRAQAEADDRAAARFVQNQRKRCA